MLLSCSTSFHVWFQITLNDRFHLMSRGYLPTVSLPRTTYFEQKPVSIIANRALITTRKDRQGGAWSVIGVHSVLGGQTHHMSVWVRSNRTSQSKRGMWHERRSFSHPAVSSVVHLCALRAPSQSRSRYITRCMLRRQLYRQRVTKFSNRRTIKNSISNGLMGLNDGSAGATLERTRACPPRALHSCFC